MSTTPVTKSASRLAVYVRVKPTIDERPIIDIVDDKTLIFDPRDAEDEPTDKYYYHGHEYKKIGAKKKKNSSYTFDKVFDPNATNYHIYETVTKPMIDATINGLNCSVFAYGATGSGKTHTMLGSLRNQCPGVIYYTSKDLFGKLTTISEIDPLPAQLRICYFEIYNEKIRDLLVPFAGDDQEPRNYINCGNKRLRTTPERCRARQQLFPHDEFNLPVRETPGGGLTIPDLTYHTPTNAEELIALLAAGNRKRAQQPTGANADSSRSHAIFQILLTRRTRIINGDNSGAEYELQTSKMSLIDLAGSERASEANKHDRSKKLLREGGNINKSLLALGNCINALADPRSTHRHIPYRNSKLTRLLRDSLGGKCRTAMIATVCQNHNHYDDTQNTLAYASRAKCIKLRPGRNFTDVAVQPKNYGMIIENQNKQIGMLQNHNDQLKIELEELKNRYNTMQAQQQRAAVESQNRYNPHLTFTNSSSSLDKSTFLSDSRFRHELESLYEERAEIKLEILRYESKFRMNELRLSFKRLDEARQQVIHGEVPRMNGNTTLLIAQGITNTLGNSEQSQALKAQLDFFEQERRNLLEKMKLNEMRIRDVISSMTTEFELKGYGPATDFDQIIEPFIMEKERTQELDEKKFGEQHAYDLAQCGYNRMMATENLLLEAVNVIRYTHAITRGRGGFSDSLESKLNQLYKKLEGKKSVIWKDDKYAMENNNDDVPLTKLSSVHDHFSLNFLTPFRNNNTVHSRRLSKNLVSLNNYTPEQSNITFDASQ